MTKVRIGVDKSKASAYLVEVLVDTIWKEKYRFNKRQKAQAVINQFFISSEQEKDFIYES